MVYWLNKRLVEEGFAETTLAKTLDEEQSTVISHRRWMVDEYMNNELSIDYVYFQVSRGIQRAAVWKQGRVQP